MKLRKLRNHPKWLGGNMADKCGANMKLEIVNNMDKMISYCPKCGNVARAKIHEDNFVKFTCEFCAAFAVVPIEIVYKRMSRSAAKEEL